MAPVTEIAYITLKPGIQLTGSSAEAKAWADSLSTIQAQEGYQRLHWGTTLENENLLMLLIDWDDVESHHKFMNAPAYGPFKKTLGTIMEGVHLFHITPTPFPPKVLGEAPCIEFAAFYSPRPTFLSSMEKFVGILAANWKEGKIEGFYGGSYGESVEGDLVKHAEVLEGKSAGDVEGVEEGKVVVGFLGWESKEAHMKFRETELFKENIGLLRTDNRGAELFHVKLTAA